MWYSWGKKTPNVYVKISTSLVRHVDIISCYDLVTNWVVCLVLSTILLEKCDQLDRRKREQSYVMKSQSVGGRRDCTVSYFREIAYFRENRVIPLSIWKHTVVERERQQASFCIYLDRRPNELKFQRWTLGKTNHLLVSTIPSKSLDHPRRLGILHCWLSSTASQSNPYQK